MEITRIHKCKNVWLHTTDAITTTGVRRFFTFYELPLIQIKKKSYLKVNSITLSGAGHQNATGHNWCIKLHNINYNQDNYYSSDKVAEPTIACLNFDTKNTIQNGLFSLMLEPQEIINLTIEIFNEEGVGAIKTHPIDFHINLLIEEYDDY